MMGYAHFATGIAAGSLIFGNPVGAICTGIGSLLPDIDTHTSTMGRKFPIISFLCGRHRGWVHSLLGLLIFGVPLWLFDSSLGYPFAIGYILHLLLDFLNPAGIKFFWPVGRYRSIIGIPGNSFIWNQVFVVISIFIIFVVVL